MSQSGTMVWLAIRELWISFRLIALLVAFVGAGAAVALLPAALATMLERLAVGLGAATLVAAGVAAWSIAFDRVHGRAAWLVSRSVPRATLVTAWFATIAGVALLGVLTAVVLGWLAAAGGFPRPDALAFGATAMGIGAGVMAAVALGLVAGVLLCPRAAAAATILLAVAVGLGAWVAPDIRQLVPGGAIAMLADLYDGSSGPAPGLASAGVSLLVAAALILLARLLLRRSDL